MPTLDWTQSDVAVNTIICASVFSVVAVVFMVTHVIFIIRIIRNFSLPDLMILAAFVITIMLVGQTIWAVVDEGQGQHAADMEWGVSEVTAKVCLAIPEQEFLRYSRRRD